MKHIRDIIIAPIVTEKSTHARTKNNAFVFEVGLNANKIEIKHAVEHLFSVHVLEVRTARIEGKTKRLGRSVGKRPDWKKAIVTLREGDNIPIFES
jgi:large subunit ribosomal protein L23